MAMLVQCPNPACRASCSVAESAEARHFKCPKCDKLFAVKPTFDGLKGDTKKHPPSSNANPFPVLPAEFGRYRILQLLGRGGMGAVYLAQDSQLGRQVALKVPFFDASESPQRAERFVREARSAAVLDHPNICTVFDAGQIDGRPFITMAYLAGKPLEDEIDSEVPMPQVRAAEIARKIALALEHAHLKGTVHRDLKPANVMMAAAGEPVVMDFGLAKRVGGEPNQAKLTHLGAILGTPSYMSPEQVKGEASAVGPATDVYALGVMLFEMLTGKTPYTGAMSVVIGRILTSPVPPVKEFRPDVHSRLDAICRKAMAKAPADRFASMAEFADALGKYLKAPAASPPPLPTPPIAAVVQAPLPVVGRSPFDDLEHATPPKPASKKAKRGQAATARLPWQKWPIIAGAAVGLLLAGLAALWAGGVFKVKTADGILVVQVNEPNAEVFVDGDRMTLSWNDGGTKAEIHVKPGTRRVEVKKDGFSVDGKELTFKDGDRDVFTARLLPEQVAKADAPAPDKSPPPNPRPVDAPAPATPRSDYDDLAKGRWVAVLPSVEEFDRLRTEKAYVVGAQPSLGAEPEFVDGVLQCNNSRMFFPPIQAKDAIVRAWVTKSGPKLYGNVALILRRDDDGQVAAFFNGGGYFGIGRMTNYVWKDLQTCRFSEQYDGAFEFAFAAVGDRLIAYANGRKILEARDEAPLDRPAAIGVGTAIGLGSFRDIEVQVLDKPPAEDQGFVPLFNGKDLTGWNRNGTNAMEWTVVDSVLVGKNNINRYGPETAGYLSTERSDYGNFHLRFETMISEGISSYVMVRQKQADLQPGEKIAYWVLLGSVNPESRFQIPGASGTLYVNYRGGPRPLVAGAPDLHLKGGEWFRQEIIAEGPRLRVLINGTTVVDYVDAQNPLSRGTISFACASFCTLRCRKIDIKELK